MYKNHKGNKKTVTIPIFPASTFRLKSQFLGNFRDILLPVCWVAAWSDKSVSIPALLAFSILPSSFCGRVPLYDVFTSNLGFEVDLPTCVLLSFRGKVHPSVTWGGHPNPPKAPQGPNSPTGAGTSWSVHLAFSAFRFTRNIPADTSLCLMGSRAPVQKNLRPHWGKVVVNNCCLSAFFFFNCLLPCIWGSGWLFSLDGALWAHFLEKMVFGNACMSRMSVLVI